MIVLSRKFFYYFNIYLITYFDIIFTGEVLGVHDGTIIQYNLQNHFSTNFKINYFKFILTNFNIF